MDSASDARRFSAGPLPSHLVRLKHAAGHGDPPRSDAETPPGAYDPLRLCIFATIALLGWLAGPVALAVFAAVGFAGYWRARRRGLTKSKCYLRDTRLVLAYLGILLAAGIWGIYALVAQVFGI
jgi:hypothetical protein